MFSRTTTCLGLIRLTWAYPPLYYSSSKKTKKKIKIKKKKKGKSGGSVIARLPSRQRQWETWKIRALHGWGDDRFFPGLEEVEEQAEEGGAKAGEGFDGI